MKTLLQLLRNTIFILLVTLPLAGKAAIEINVQYPKTNILYDDNLYISVFVSSTYAYHTVEASVGGRSVTLTVNPMLGNYSGYLSLTGLPQGPSTLSIFVKDVLGNTQTKNSPFIFNSLPVVKIEAPTAHTTYQSKIRIKASVSDVGSVNCSGIISSPASIPSLTIHFINSIDTLVDMFPDNDFIPSVTISISGIDSAGQVKSVEVPVHRNNSNALKPYFTSDGDIIDFKDTRLLMTTTGENGLTYYKIVNMADSSVDSIRLGPKQDKIKSIIKAKLCQGGAAFVIYYNTDSSITGTHIYVWKNDSLINISQPLGLSAGLNDMQSEGQYLMWLTQNGPIAITNLNTFNTSFTGTGSYVVNTSNKLSKDGDIAYVASASTSNYNVYRYSISSQVTQQLTTTNINTRPVIDGKYTAYITTVENSGTTVFYNYLNDGVNTYNLGRTLSFAENRMSMNNGYTLFLKSDSASGSQTWLRSPDGTLKQLSYFSYPSYPDGVDSSGRSLFINNWNRYYADSLTGSKMVCGIGGTTYLRNNEFYLAMGGTLFKYDIPSATFLPALLSFSPDSVSTGDTVTIKGKNLIGVSTVSFGGTPATSFSMISDSVLTAVVGAGTSGVIAISTPGGTATIPGFTYVPPPSITGMSPTSGTTGTTITITGTNFTGTTSVAFGDSAVTSFVVNSPTSIIAVVGAGASGNVSVTTPGGKATLDGFNFIFTLPADNFKITNTSASCKGSANGTINISAVKKLNYTATVTGNGQSSTHTFTSAIDLKDLSAGSYNICLTVAGQPGYQQCFTSVIAEPKDLSVYMAINKTPRQVVLSLDGATQYQVTLNGSTITTNKSELTLALKEGVNTVSVSTDKLCQGQITKEIIINDGMSIFPNPFLSSFTINIGNSNVKRLLVSLFNTGGKIVYSRSYANQSGNISISLPDLSSGLYMLKLSADNKEKTFKLLKK
ncbi:T9SS type A sorting domain-containing protein [Chitinophaga sp.]|uniref:T9SS type A sorting domain-containing protein n=1 Tax=Chitinophaga sp. TaxID=1869181 RepID=UPI002F954433